MTESKINIDHVTKRKGSWLLKIYLYMLTALRTNTIWIGFASCKTVN